LLLKGNRFRFSVVYLRSENFCIVQRGSTRMNSDRIAPAEAARRIWQSRYADSRVLFLAGSVMRGEGTPTSDLDIVLRRALLRRLREPLRRQTTRATHRAGRRNVAAFRRLTLRRLQARCARRFA
jgi:predicted nucleotidyltransferase